MAHKVFVRSNKHGSATKVVREQYLRTDIACSSRVCGECYLHSITNADGTSIPPVLSESPHSTTKRGPHYVVIDTNIALRAIDLLEHRSAFYDVIVPQTVLDETRNKSLPVYNRLRALTNGRGEEKRFYVFHNGFHMDTYVQRKQKESPNDYNDRLIRKVVEWYNKHLQGQATDEKNRVIKKMPETVLVTDDRANLALAKQEGLNAVSLKDYLLEQVDGEELLDLVPTHEEHDESLKSQGALTSKESIYPEFYPMSRLMGGVKNGTLHQGMFGVSRYSKLEGYVNVKDYSQPILVLGRKNQNRAFARDLVVVELLSESQWRAAGSEIFEEDEDDDVAGLDDDDEIESIETEAEKKSLAELAKKTQKSGKAKLQPTGRVVGIIKRNWRAYVGHISLQGVDSEENRANGLRSVLVTPMDKGVPRIRIRTRKAGQLAGKRIVVAVDQWSANSRHPDGHFVRELGAIESEEAETEALLLEHDVEYRPFPKSVLDCLPPEGHNWVIPAKDHPSMKGRADLRDLLVCSIDPPGCQDIDDALHARKLPNGNYEVGVHIADVTNFVKPNTPLDDEGAARGTSVYLVDKRIDMLPMLLGTDLCSLKPDVERFAFSVLWEMTEDAEIVNTTFTKSIIHSREAFSYDRAQIRIDDASQQDELTQGMRSLLRFSKILKQKRLDAGALNLASPEVKVHTDSETSDPGSVEIKQLLETNSLVEEFMLLANISVARRIYEEFPQAAMLRRHEEPSATNFTALNEQLRLKKGMILNLQTSKALAESLDECVDPKEPFFNTLVRIMATRCMTAAEYFPAGVQGRDQFRHYGLAADIYTHFTSPIRRYADVVAHRQLAAAIQFEGIDPSQRDKSRMERICQNINKRHRNAQFAGRASIEYYVGQMLKASESNQEGFIIKVFSNGVNILVPKFGVESLIPLADIGDASTASYEEDTYTLKIKTRSGNDRAFSVFDKVTVYVSSVKDETTGKRKVHMQLRE